MARRFGQHFLTSETAASRILQACRLEPDDVVVEIGPGRGFLTRPLLARAGRVVGVELDRRLHPVLREAFAGASNWTLVEGDFLKLAGAALPSGPVKFVGNLPYDVGTAILRRVVRRRDWTLAVFMLQKEVVDRLLAEPGTKAYGPLTIETALRAAGERVSDVPAASFRPPPRVESAVLRLRPRRLALGGASEEAVMAAVYAAFRQRRKKILNSLASALKLEKAAVERALREAGIDPSCRAETVPIGGFLKLALSLVPLESGP